MESLSNPDSDHGRSIGLETIGKRIAQLRIQTGLTQQALASRIAISRVAVSHIEMDLTLPSERTITLLAGVFKLSPYELISGTLYPRAKAERLPELVCCYTKLELDLALLENDLSWLRRLQTPTDPESIKDEITQKWSRKLDYYTIECLDEDVQRKIAAAREKVNAMLAAPTPSPPEKR